MSLIIGYLKPGLNVQSQLDQVKAAGATRIIQEQSTDTKRDWSQLDKLLKDVRVGDTVVVTSFDQIAHSARHLLEIVKTLDAAGAAFKVIDHGIDTSTPHGQLLPVLLSAITDFERQIIRQRQAEGIDMAKRQGRYKGRKPTAMAKATEVLELNAHGLTKQKIADQLGIGVASIYRILKNHTTPKKTRKKKLKKPVDKPTRESVAEQLSLFSWDVKR
ncbi:MAG: recombinase family protein [Desulfuromonadales bacterium]|nr:recombinase family protein [Desulfuromonadales bacterium]